MTKATAVRTPGEWILGKIQKRTAWIRYMSRNVVRRVRASETQAQKIRPNALPIETTPTMPAAAIAVTCESSWNIGASCEMTEIPADVFRNRSNQRAHHCHALIASPKL